MRRILANKYEVLEELGRGGTGRVYRVRDLHLNVDLAAKEIDGCGKGEAERKSLAREANVLKGLRHPGLPRVVDFFTENGCAYLVMEYVEGISLQRYLDENGAMREEEARRMAVELAEILRYLHSQHPPVVYQDLKPANVMLCRDGAVRLIDFGTAVFQKYDGGRENFRAGTRGYAAPEQWESGGEEGGADRRSDFYAFGVTLFFLLTGVDPGRPPYVMAPVREYDAALSEGIQEVVLRCTCRKKEERYQTDESLLEELKGCRRLEKRRRARRRTAKAVFFLCLTVCVLAAFAGVEKGGGYFGLCVSSFGAACLTAFLSGRGGRRRGRKQEKNIWLTEKKGVGLILLAVCLLAGGLETPWVRAAERAQSGGEETLPVVVRDEGGRKLVIRYDAVYRPEGDMRIELPEEIFERGEEYLLRIVATQRRSGRSMERVFRVTAE